MKKSYEEICENWGIDAEKNKHHFEWLKADPSENRKLTREIGLCQHSREVKRLKRVHTEAGIHFYSIKTNELFTGKVQVSAMDFYF